MRIEYEIQGGSLQIDHGGLNEAAEAVKENLTQRSETPQWGKQSRGQHRCIKADPANWRSVSVRT